MADETTDGVGVGDRVTFVDTNGDEQRAVCSTVHGPDTIAVVYRDGAAFDEHAFVDGDLVERTSVPAATEIDEPFSYVEGGWSA